MEVYRFLIAICQKTTDLAVELGEVIKVLRFQMLDVYHREFNWALT